MVGDSATSLRTVGRASIALIVTIVFLASAWAVFVIYPTDFTELLGVVLVILVVPVAVRAGSSAVSSVAPGYNVAEVAVDGQISRATRSGPVPKSVGANADDIVEQIERANASRNVEALLVKLNTPGGEIVPSEDIRIAAERFEGPTIAYTTDMCASGGYDIASGCDELWARNGSIVGSIGVIGSRVNVSDLADRMGVSYEQFTAGEYKDAGVPLKDLSEDEREYLQGIVDGYYEEFVDTVADGRELDPETIRDTEARIYLGTEAAELGLVDEIGTRNDVETRLEERLGKPVSIEEFTPSAGLRGRFRGGVERVAYAFGAGVASVFDDRDGFNFRF